MSGIDRLLTDVITLVDTTGPWGEEPATPAMRNARARAEATARVVVDPFGHEVVATKLFFVEPGATIKPLMRCVHGGITYTLVQVEPADRVSIWTKKTVRHHWRAWGTHAP